MIFKKGDLLEVVDNHDKPNLIIGSRHLACQDGVHDGAHDMIRIEPMPDTGLYAHRFICVRAVCTCDRRYIAQGGGCTCGAFRREVGSREEHEERMARIAAAKKPEKAEA